MCCKAIASACAPDTPILFPNEDIIKRKLVKFKYNKEELYCKVEASACAPVESILLPK